MYNNNTMNFQESTTTLNACSKKVCKLMEDTTYMYKQDLALNSLQVLICHNTPTK